MIYTEDKAKVVAAFCHASYFPPEWFEEKGEFILLFISSWCNSTFSSYHPSEKQLAQQEIE